MRELKDVYIIDDVVSNPHADYLAKYYTGQEVDWFFQKDITFHKSNKNFETVVSHNIGFANLIYSMGHVSSPLYHTIAPIMYNALSRVNVEPLRILQARAFMQLPMPGPTESINNIFYGAC
jgi:hypothetical protein